MAIVNSEYGPVDSVTGRPVATSESGMFYADTGESYSPTQGAALPDSAYIVRGDYRLPNVGLGGSRMGGGTLEVRGANGAWAPVTAATAPAGYDPRQDSDTQGSNERLRFDQAFSNAPADVPITGMQEWAIANGWTEPDRSNNEGTFGAMLSNVVPGALAVVGGVYAMGGFSAALAGAPAAEAAATAASTAASETAAMSAWAAVPAESGLMSNVLTNAAIGAGKSLVTGEDPLKGAILGGVGGAISGSGMLGDVSGGLIDATGATGAAATAITKGVNAAATGAIGALANGGSFSDVLSGGVVGGLTSGVGNYAAGTLLPGTNSTVAGGAGGAASGLIQAALTGGDIGSGILTGGLAGAAGGLAKDMGAGPVTAGAVGALTGGLIKSAVQQDPVSAARNFNPPPMVSTTPSSGKFSLSFSDIIPQFSNKKVPWGTRLSGA